MDLSSSANDEEYASYSLIVNMGRRWAIVLLEVMRLREGKSAQFHVRRSKVS